jgi:hypothetical protein
VPELAQKVPAGRALEESMHDLGMGHAREFSTALEILERLIGLLGARPQVP